MVWDRSMDDRGGPERVGDSWVGLGRVVEPPERFGTGWEVRDRSGDPQRGTKRVAGLSGRSGMGQGTLGEVWEGSG